jgi:hypothetical protein
MLRGRFYKIDPHDREFHKSHSEARLMKSTKAQMLPANENNVRY